MSGGLDNYVKNVIAFTSAESYRELVELNRKALTDVLEKSGVPLTQILEMLNVEEHSLSFVTILLAKLNQACSAANSEEIEETLSQIEMFLPFFNRTQIILAPDICKVFSLFLSNHIKNVILLLCFNLGIRFSDINFNEHISRGILLLSGAINAIIGEPGELTSLHSCLFCLCLKSKLFEPALRFLETPVSRIMKETPGDKVDRGYMDSRFVLLYFYYGGLIYGALGRLDDSLLMMQNVLCIPALLTSAIMIEAYKKYLLMSLISHGKVKALPGYRAMVVQKLQRFCFEYQFFENICTMDSSDKDLAQEIMNHLQAHHAVFFKDNNVGLIKRLARKMREASIIKLSKTFLSVSLGDLARRCHLHDWGNAERYLMEMNAENKICVTLDKEHGLVYFDEPKTVVDEETLNSVIKAGMNLTSLLKTYDTRLRTNYMYIARSTKVSALCAHDDEGFQQGTSGANVLPMMGIIPNAVVPSFELNMPS
ncbi:unnamed protein product [Enterobius vermicularis]|uniref:COP9 signalosome complex subunit 3 n=1 Tax=Enterobius vermicularis TaxID=51028 RepID=A0A158Q9Y3_ENTVE|nr:unnamed protein product [Enterobius vermicularis]